MTGGAMVATMIITWRVLYPLQALCAVLPHLEQIRASLAQVSQLMSYTPEAHAAHVVLAEHPLKGNIDIQHLGLRYGRKSDPVFMGLSAEIAAGEIVAIYGGNGTGKSSILRLLLGLYAPAMGSIRLDGVDHRQFDPRSLRRQIAYLPQLPELLPGTIADNLRVHNPLAEDYQLRQALLWADALEMVEALQAGLNTRLGEGGYIPSSGFASRLCLARLYLAERPLVLCDELPAQLLNSSTGERFRRFLEECRGRRTVLFVTHREDWLHFADKIIWFKANMRPVVSRPGQAPAQAA
jgi:ABC-type bacteriocin/lantibiotic exporter with double-glycine peptidase domain